MTKFSGNLPKGDANGLTSLANALIRNPKGTHIIVGVIDVKTVTTDVDTGDQEATVRFRRVEAIDQQDADHALRMLARGVERRTGATMLPLEVEDELSALVDSLDWAGWDGMTVDTDTGEIKPPADVNPDVGEEQTADAEGDNEPARGPDGPPAETPEPVPAESPAEPPAIVPEGSPETPEPTPDPVTERPAETPAPEQETPVKAPAKKRGRPRKTPAKETAEPKPQDEMPDFTVPDDLSGWDTQEAS
jgi:hypothetical protein